MKLKQKTIRKTNRLLIDLEEQQSFLLGVKITDYIKSIIKTKFDLNSLVENEIIYPKPSLGRYSMINSNGIYISDKNKEKEVAYRPHEYNLTGWDGKTYSGTCYIPYKRYPRIFLPPAEIKMIIRKINDESYFCVLKKFKKQKSMDEDIKFAANLLLEFFGEVDTLKFDEHNSIVLEVPVEKVNWEILPQGEVLWESIKNISKSIATRSELYFIKQRFEFLLNHNPSFIKEGLGGYTGYLVYGFEEKNIYIMDSIIYGNATYIFEGEWKVVSRLTKSEIIKNKLAKDRIVHNNNWEENINKYFE